MNIFRGASSIREAEMAKFIQKLQVKWKYHLLKNSGFSLRSNAHITNTFITTER